MWKFGGRTFQVEGIANVKTLGQCVPDCLQSSKKGRVTGTGHVRARY